jgi:uncharacterized membrane protein
VQAVGRNLLHVLTFGVAAYVVFAYAFQPMGAFVHPDMKAAFLAHTTAIYIHAFAAMVALMLGPFQFSARLRRERPALHRWLGRLYLTVGVLVGGVAGLYLARHAFGGTGSQLGFALLAGLWLFTGLQAYRAIRRRAFDAHRRWMVRNFALTLAAVTLRIYMPLSQAAGIGFALAYPIIAWLCWVPNLVIAEWRFNAGDTPSPL